MGQEETREIMMPFLKPRPIARPAVNGNRARSPYAGLPTFYPFVPGTFSTLSQEATCDFFARSGFHITG